MFTEEIKKIRCEIGKQIECLKSKLCNISSFFHMMIEECCSLPAGTAQVDTYCQDFGFEAENGLEGRTYTFNLGGGLEFSLPGPYTQQQVLDGLNNLAPNGGRNISSDGKLCRTDGQGAVSLKSFYCNATGTQCALSAVVPVQFFVEQGVPLCKKYFNVKTKYEEPTAGNIQSMDSSLQSIDATLKKILEKDCEQVELLQKLVDSEG